MSPYDDDSDVSGNDLHDIVTMAMARRTLRSLVPDAPPTPSEQLALVLREGLPPSPASSRWGRVTGRVASLGVAAKLLLATGVAVAGVGGAATAVAISHESSHHEDRVDSPRNHPVAGVPSPTSTDRGAAESEPTAHPTTFAPAQAEHHGGQSTDDGGHSDGSGSHDSGSGTSDSGSGDSGSGDSGSGDSGSGDSGSGGSGSGSTDSGSSSDGGGSTSTSGDSSGSTSSGSGSDGGGSGSSDGGSGDATPSPSPTSDS